MCVRAALRDRREYWSGLRVPGPESRAALGRPVGEGESCAAHLLAVEGVEVGAADADRVGLDLGERAAGQRQVRRGLVWLVAGLPRPRGSLFVALATDQQDLRAESTRGAAIETGAPGRPLWAARCGGGRRAAVGRAAHRLDHGCRRFFRGTRYSCVWQWGQQRRTRRAAFAAAGFRKEVVH